MSGAITLFFNNKPISSFYGEYSTDEIIDFFEVPATHDLWLKNRNDDVRIDRGNRIVLIGAMEFYTLRQLLF